MAEVQISTCSKCGTEFVAAKKDVVLNGELPLDGTWDFDNKVCPKCHPEFAETAESK